eukprot:m.21590 g.21590  ORF g.21590 m.21590 type:complete len:369 (-) comp8736_c0_seq1:265-1371(-)
MSSDEDVREEEEVTLCEEKPIDENSLPSLYKSVVGCISSIQKAPPASDEQAKLINKGILTVEKAIYFLQQLGVFSDNEEYTEHSTLSLRYLALPYLHGELLSRKFVKGEKAIRDRERIKSSTRARQLFQQYLRNLVDMDLPFARREVLDYYTTVEPGARRDRDSKMAHFKALKSTKTTVSELEDLMRQRGITEEDDDDDEVVRGFCLSLLHQYMLQAIDQIEMLGMEISMLEHIVKQRMEGVEPLTTEEMKKKKKQEKKKPEPPMVLTADMVKKMSLSGQSVNRENFKLLTAGYGRIGAPTMSLQQLADMEMAQAREAQERQLEADRNKVELDPDSEEGSIVKTYELRERDEWRDQHKAGEGNRYNMG